MKGYRAYPGTNGYQRWESWLLANHPQVWRVVGQNKLLVAGFFLLMAAVLGWWMAPGQTDLIEPADVWIRLGIATILVVSFGVSFVLGQQQYPRFGDATENQRALLARSGLSLLMLGVLFAFTATYLGGVARQAPDHEAFSDEFSWHASYNFWEIPDGQAPPALSSLETERLRRAIARHGYVAVDSQNLFYVIADGRDSSIYRAFLDLSHPGYTDGSSLNNKSSKYLAAHLRTVYNAQRFFRAKGAFARAFGWAIAVFILGLGLNAVYTLYRPPAQLGPPKRETGRVWWRDGNRWRLIPPAWYDRLDRGFLRHLPLVWSLNLIPILGFLSICCLGGGFWGYFSLGKPSGLALLPQSPNNLPDYMILAWIALAIPVLVWIQFRRNRPLPKTAFSIRALGGSFLGVWLLVGGCIIVTHEATQLRLNQAPKFAPLSYTGQDEFPSTKPGTTLLPALPDTSFFVALDRLGYTGEIGDNPAVDQSKGYSGRLFPYRLTLKTPDGRPVSYAQAKRHLDYVEAARVTYDSQRKTQLDDQRNGFAVFALIAAYVLAILGLWGIALLPRQFVGVFATVGWVGIISAFLDGNLMSFSLSVPIMLTLALGIGSFFVWRNPTRDGNFFQLFLAGAFGWPVVAYMLAFEWERVGNYTVQFTVFLLLLLGGFWGALTVLERHYHAPAERVSRKGWQAWADQDS